MDQDIGSNKLTTYLHPNSTDLFVELKRESIKSSSPDLIDIDTYNSFYQRLIETTSSDRSSDKSFIDSSVQMAPVSQINYPNHSNRMNFIDSSKTNEISRKTNFSTSSITNRKVKHIIEENFSTDQYISSEYPKVILNKHEYLPISDQNDNDLRSNYQLSNFIIKIEQMPNIWTINSSNNKSIKKTADNNNKRSLPIINKETRRSPVIHNLSGSLSKSYPTHSLSDLLSNRSDSINNPNSRSPQYRPRLSYVNPSKIKSKSSKGSRQLCRSPVFIRRPHKIIDTDFEPTLQPMALLSLDTNESMSPNNNEHSTQHLSLNTNKRSLETSPSEQIFTKRRHQTSLPIILTQKQYCISYSINIQRCVDCQTIKTTDLSAHPTGCRFQYCRTLKYYGDNKYKIEGFTTVDKATLQDTEYLITPNSGGQPALNAHNANHIFQKIAKFFCLMSTHEENERSMHDSEEIIWKRYMAGWREVCDECSTTLFNYHYMCKICGYMICIECSNEYSQMNIEKRKKIQRICPHQNSYCLSELIPWKILTNLRNQSINYFTKLNLDYSMKLYPATRNENLSAFIKSLKIKRGYDKRDTQKIWSTIDCNLDTNIEFYCNGRLPVFNEWISQNAKQFFQKVWATGCPVLVKRVHQNLSKTLWQPDSFKLHMIDYHDTPTLWDCETRAPIQTNKAMLAQFWDGFERLNIRLKDSGRARILKLKDWPTKKDFASVFPTRLHDLMTNIPFSDYTRRSYEFNGVKYHGGVYNIVERLPACLVKPDLGPKLFIAYSQLSNQSSRKAGTTPLHIDASDAVNVLVYVGIGGHGDDGLDKEEEIQQVEAEILNSNIDTAQLQRLRNGERPGALWHLFRSDDVKKIREYMGRTQRKTSGSDCIHDQSTYLEKEDLDKLKEWSNVESYPVLQFLGDAIFIPSGAPHQVKNLHSCIKIAEDFVSPENLDRSLITTNEFRSLSKTHTNHADILQAKNILYYATRDALNSLIR